MIKERHVKGVQNQPKIKFFKNEKLGGEEPEMLNEFIHNLGQESQPSEARRGSQMRGQGSRSIAS